MPQQNIPLPLDNNHNEVAISFNNETIAQIILEFLGNKETLVYKEKNCSFLLRLNDLEQFHYLLEQKVLDQKNILQLHLTVNFNYSDKTSRTINGFTALQSFNEIRNVSIISTTLTWKIVNKFFNHEHVTTQTIELTFDTNNEEILLTITHTSQAWALEIKNLFCNKINEVIIRDSKIAKIYKEVGNKSISQLLPILMFSFVLFIPFLQMKENSLKSSLSTNIISSFDEKTNSNDKLLSLNSINIFKSEQAIQIFKNSNVLNDVNLRNRIILNLENYNQKYLSLMIWSLFSIFSIVLLAPLITIKYSKYAYNKIKSQTAILTNNYMNEQYKNLVESKKSLPFYSLSFISISILIGLIINFISTLIM